MNMKSMYLAGCLLALVSLGACTKDKDEKLNDVDTNFMVQAAYSNLAEIDAGTLAATKGQKDSVKMYGTMMVQEHTLAHTELKALAASKNVSLPTEPDEENKMIKQRLLALNGYAFDTAYIKSQIAGHAKTVAVFQTELSSGQNKDVLGYANKYFPHIQMHLELAQRIAKGLY